MGKGEDLRKRIKDAIKKEGKSRKATTSLKRIHLKSLKGPKPKK